MPLKADEHPEESMGCSYVFECDFVAMFVCEKIYRYIERYANRECDTTKKDTKKCHFCSCFVI